MKRAETASYNAVPSILIVAPIGNTNLETLESILFSFSKQSNSEMRREENHVWVGYIHNTIALIFHTR